MSAEEVRGDSSEFRNAESYFNQKKYDEVLQALAQAATKRRTKTSSIYTPASLNLALKTAFYHTYSSSSSRDLQTILKAYVEGEEKKEEICEHTLKAFRELCQNVNDKIKEMVENPTPKDLVHASLSGVPLQTRAEQLYRNPITLYTDCIIWPLFGKRRSVKNLKKILPPYNRTLLTFVNICVEFKLDEALPKLVKAVEQFYESVCNEEFFRSETLVSEGINTLTDLLEILKRAGHLKQAWSVMRCLNIINKKFLTSETDFDRAVYVKGQKSIAALLWEVKKYPQHAYILNRAAPLDNTDQSNLLSQAILATLCCCEDTTEKDEPLFSANESNYMNNLFGRESSSVRHIEVQLRNIISLNAASVNPAAVKLLNDFTNPSYDNFDELSNNLNAFMKANPSLTMYETHLRNLILKRQIIHSSKLTSRISADDLIFGGAKLSDANFLSTFDNLLSDEKLSVEVDCANHSLLLRNALKNTITSTFSTLASKFPNPVPPKAPLDLAVFDIPASESPKLKITINDLTSASQRTLNIHSLGNHSLDSQTERQKKLKEEELEKLEKKRKMRQKEEEQKRERVKTREFNRLKGRYYERQRQERALLVLKRLREVYPGFKVDDSIAFNTSASTLEDTLTAMVADFQRKRVQAEQRDTLKANLAERALRQMEIPKRDEFNRQNAGARKAEVAASRENFLAQHREEYEKRQREKQVLRKFVKDAAIFEERAGKDTSKASKRDVQESLLEQEKRRLAEES